MNNNTNNPYTPPDYQGMHLKGEIFLHNYSLTTSVRLEPTQIYLSYYSKKEEDIQNRHKDLLLDTCNDEQCSEVSIESWIKAVNRHIAYSNAMHEYNKKQLKIQQRQLSMASNASNTNNK